MPKFTYSASKGIEQSSGQGFFVQDVPVSPSSETIATGNSASDNEGLGVAKFSADGTTITIEDGVAVGQQKILVITTGGTPTVNDTSGAITGVSAVAHTTGDVLLIVWNGTNWKLLS